MKAVHSTEYNSVCLPPNMLGKKMSNSASSKGRGSLTGSQSKITMKTATATASMYPQATLVPPTYSAESHPPGLSHIKTNDNFKMLPRYSVALSRPHDESLPAEELDAIQLELEILLSAVALRYRNIKSEYESIDREDKRQKKGQDKQPHSPSATGNSSKRKREESKKMSKEAKYFPNQAKLSKLKNSSSHSPVHSQHTDDSMDAVPCLQSTHHIGRTGTNEHPNKKVMVPKNDIPNKFWLSVEPYCMPITQEDIRLLDDLNDEYNGALVPSVPELGPHYISQWAAEDLRDEQDNSNQNAKANKRFTNSTNSDATDMIRKGESLISEGITGPLTQRLLAALLEENIMPNDTNVSGELHSNESNDSAGAFNAISNRGGSLASILTNGIDVEKRLKKELMELGILDMSDFPKEKEDEVLNEIRRVRTELYAIADYNKNELKTLHDAAKVEMKRLEIKRRLDVVDQEIIESYKKVWAIKQKKRPLTKQERDEIFRLTEEQKRLSDLLETMPIPGYNSTVCSSSSAN